MEQPSEEEQKGWNDKAMYDNHIRNARQELDLYSRRIQGNLKEYTGELLKGILQRAVVYISKAKEYERYFGQEERDQISSLEFTIKEYDAVGFIAGLVISSEDSKREEVAEATPQ